MFSVLRFQLLHVSNRVGAMKKVFISVRECEPGMKVAETIYNNFGAIIIAQDTILDEHLIRKLGFLDINRVRIYHERHDTITENSPQMFRLEYNKNIDVVKDLLHDILSGKDLSMQKVNSITQSIFERINENRDIIGCLNLIRSADEYTYTHCMNVSLLSMMIGKWLKFDHHRIKLLVQAGLLHDIGKCKIPDEILNKPGKLLPHEYEEIKKHTTLGYRIVERVPSISKDICMGVLMHHERIDGSGYPLGVKGLQIHDFAKVIGISDVYDAMTSNRVYHEKESPFEVFELMENNSFGILDPVVVNTFLKNIADYYIGDFVRLNTGEVGEIIYINSRHISQPLIRVDSAYVDLTVERSIKVRELL